MIEKFKELTLELCRVCEEDLGDLTFIEELACSITHEIETLDNIDDASCVLQMIEELMYKLEDLQKDGEELYDDEPMEREELCFNISDALSLCENILDEFEEFY